MQSWAGEVGRGLQGSLIHWGHRGQREFLQPPEGRREVLGITENGAAPPALILADLKASPSGHLKYLPHPSWFWLSTQGSQRH